MSSVTTFDSTAENLKDLLESVKDLKTQLPDFQRGWVWDDERIRNLLVSISLSYPIGSVMMLQTGNPNVRFAPRAVQGVEINGRRVEPERLILDGQQRLTSLYQSLMTKAPVKTRNSRGKEIERLYYIDIDKMIAPDQDREDAIIGVPGDRIVKGTGNKIVADYSNLKKECQVGMLPVNSLFDPQALFEWQTQYFTDQSQFQERSVKWQKLMSDVFPSFQLYLVPVIMLKNQTPKEAVCQVFEHVNTGGVSLTVFELLTATFAADSDQFHLREDWQSKEDRLKRSGDVHNKILADISSTDLLQTVTLLTTYNRKKNKPNAAVSCKRRDILKLTLNEYQAWADRAVDGLVEAAKFLQEQSVFSVKDLPYGSQLIPLAAIFVELGSKIHDVTVRRKMARWYWSGVLGELYGSGTETRFARDLSDVLDWIDGGPEPGTIRDANFAADRLFTLRTRNSAAYKGLHVLLMRYGGKDFISGVPIDLQTYYGDGIDIHHIFPTAYCDKQNIDSKRYNCIINKTPLSFRTNRSIGGNAPSDYLEKLERNIPSGDLNAILETHLINGKALKTNDFEQFFEERRKTLLQIIEDVMEKKVV